jgi:DNA polymerase
MYIKLNLFEIEDFKKEVLSCTKCPLSLERTNVVFGEGNLQSKVMCIGEGPGRDEDLQGRPFVGKSGQLLDKILYACGFNRNENVFIANIVKCRPPNNRAPFPEERKQCLPYLYKQIELINPTILILLGATALNGLIDETLKISQVRGKWLKWQNRWVMPTYHPAALLRNPKLKVEAWEDFKNVVYKYRELVNPKHIAPHC